MDLLEDYAQDLFGPHMLEFKKTREEALKQMHEKIYIQMLKKGLRCLRWLYLTFRSYEKFERDFNQIEISLQTIKEMAQHDGVEIDETRREIAELEKSLYNLLDRKREKRFKY